MSGVPFGKVEYWDERFTRNESPFDWLLPPEALDRPILEAIGTFPTHPQIHHIGCGTSSVSLHLRKLVENPQQIHNTDFSKVAIEIGEKWEQHVFNEAEGSKSGNGTTPKPINTSINGSLADGAAPEGQRRQDDGAPHEQPLRRMCWSTLDLLSLDQILLLPRRYDITIDKSTSDSISCAEDPTIVLPYPLRATDSKQAYPPLPPNFRSKVHPLHLLAVHLAYLTSPGGRWIALSYSGSRFPYWPPYPGSVDEGLLQQEIVDGGFVHPGRLWRLESQEMLQAPRSETDGDHVVHRPKIVYYLYVMARTNVALERI